MTRRASILGYCLAIAVLLLGLQSWSIAVARIEGNVIAAIASRTGLVVTRHERAEIALLPLPRISLSNVEFNHDGSALAGTALRLRATVQLLPLLLGRFGFDRIDLVGPQIDVAVNAPSGGFADWLAPPVAALAAMDGNARIVINGGAVFMRANGVIQTILRDVNLVIGERDREDPLEISGTVNWRGVSNAISVLWPLGGSAGKLMLSATSPLMNLQFSGQRAALNEAVIQGDLSLSTRSFQELLAWFGERPRLASAIGEMSLKADAQIKSNEASLSTVTVSIGGETLIGAIKLSDASERLALSGTLAGTSLDLGALLSRLQAAPVTAANERDPLNFSDWTGHDVDLRISVEAARFNGARLSDAALYLLVKKGRFEAGLLRAGAYGGSGKGRALAVAAPGGIELKLQGNFDKLALGQAAAALPGLPKLSGVAAGQWALEGTGSTAEEIMATLNGKVSLAVRQGELAGFAFAELLRRADRAPALAQNEWRQGKTGFETAQVTLNIANGEAVVTEGVMSGPSYRLSLAGQASLARREIEMGMLLAPLTGTTRLPFTLRGPLDAPVLELERPGPPRANGAGATPVEGLR